MEFKENSSNSYDKDRDIKKVEFLGHTSDSFSKDYETNKWDYIDIFYPNQENFCDVTSRLINNMKDDCRFIVVDEEGERHFVNVLDVRFDSIENKIRVFPEDCRKVKR